MGDGDKKIDRSGDEIKFVYNDITLYIRVLFNPLMLMFMKKRMKISRPDFVKVMDNVSRGTIVRVKSRTPVRMNKTGNPYFGEVYKTSEGIGMIGNVYESRINNNLEKEGKDKDFVVGRNKVGVHKNRVIVTNTKTDKKTGVVTTKDHFMYEWFFEKPHRRSFDFQGNPIDKKLFESWLVQTNGYYTQPTDRKVLVLQPELTNILEVTYQGTIYELTD